MFRFNTLHLEVSCLEEWFSANSFYELADILSKKSEFYGVGESVDFSEIAKDAWLGKCVVFGRNLLFKEGNFCVYEDIEGEFIEGEFSVYSVEDYEQTKDVEEMMVELGYQQQLSFEDGRIVHKWIPPDEGN